MFTIETHHVSENAVAKEIVKEPVKEPVKEVKKESVKDDLIDYDEIVADMTKELMEKQALENKENRLSIEATGYAFSSLGISLYSSIHSLIH